MQDEGRCYVTDWHFAPLAGLSWLKSLALTGPNLFCPACLSCLTRLTGLHIACQPFRAERSYANLAHALPHMLRLRQLETPLPPTVAAALPGRLRSLFCRPARPGSPLPAGLAVERLVAPAAMLLASVAELGAAALRHVGVYEVQGAEQLQALSAWAAVQPSLRSMLLLPGTSSLGSVEFDAAGVQLQQRSVRLERCDVGADPAVLWRSVLSEPRDSTCLAHELAPLL